MSDAADRKATLKAALDNVLDAAGMHSPEGALHVSWPLVLVDAVLKSESAGDATRQDSLIEAIATLLGIDTEESLSIPEATDRLAGERSRGFIISTLHGFQVSAEAKVKEIKAERAASSNPDDRVDLVAQSRHHQGVVEALGYAIELVNLSALPADNDQQIGELITVEEAQMLAGLFEEIPEQVMGALEMTDDLLPALIRRLRKAAQ